MVGSRVSIDEAVEYGFHMLLGIAKYLILMAVLGGIGFFITTSDVCMDIEMWELCGMFSLAVMILISLISTALTIGVAYKLIADAV